MADKEVRLIDKDKLIKKINAEIDAWAKSRMCMTADELLETIEEFEEEAQPVKHGWWIEEHTNQILWLPNEHESYNAQDTSLTERRCSNCKLWSVDFTSRIIMNFCPMCGARMDGDSE